MFLGQGLFDALAAIGHTRSHALASGARLAKPDLIIRRKRPEEAPEAVTLRQWLQISRI